MLNYRLSESWRSYSGRYCTCGSRRVDESAGFTEAEVGSINDKLDQHNQLLFKKTGKETSGRAIAVGSYFVLVSEDGKPVAIDCVFRGSADHSGSGRGYRGRKGSRRETGRGCGRWRRRTKRGGNLKHLRNMYDNIQEGGEEGEVERAGSNLQHLRCIHGSIQKVNWPAFHFEDWSPVQIWRSPSSFRCSITTGFDRSNLE